MSAEKSSRSFDCRCRSICGTRPSISHLCLCNVVLSLGVDPPLDDHQVLSRVILGLTYANDLELHWLDLKDLPQFHSLDFYGIVNGVKSI